jgi:hypothetical protein
MASRRAQDVLSSNTFASTNERRNVVARYVGAITTCILGVICRCCSCLTKYFEKTAILVACADVRKVPRHIQKQREEAAAAGHSPQTPNGMTSNGYFERPGGLSEMEMEDEVWSQSEATPVVQHFPSKGLPPPGEWQSLHPGSPR